jgi:trans-aconitate methyltransferase
MSASDSRATTDWDPQAYARHAAFVPARGAPLLDWLTPSPGMRVLDLGCGDGVLTQSLIAAGCIVVGVDASLAFVDTARAKGIDARCVDGQALDFDAEFDAVFSNAALHWMRERPDAVIAGVARALRKDGVFVAEMGGHGNVEQVRRALREVLAQRNLASAITDPWFFPTAEDYGARLERGGFEVERIELFERPTPLPSGVRGWVETFAQPFANRLSPAQAGPIVDEVTRILESGWRQPDGSFVADYVRLRFRARKRSIPA